MKYRLKVRVTRQDGKSSKVAFEVDADATYVIQSTTPGFEGIGKEGTYFKLSIAEGVIWAARESGTRLVVEPGMIITTGMGQVEFLEVPPINPESAQTRTQTVEVQTTIQATAAPVGDAPFELESTFGSTAGSANAGETEKSPSQNSYRPITHPSAKAGTHAFTQPEMVLDALTGSIVIETDAPAPPIERTTASWRSSVSVMTTPVETPRIGSRASFEPERSGSFTPVEEQSFTNIEEPSMLGIIGSVAAIAVFSDLAIRVAQYFRPELSMIRPGMGAGSGVLIACLIAGVTNVSSTGVVLASIAWGSAMLPVWAASFAFASRVELFTAVLAAVVWVVIFFKRLQNVRVLQLAPIGAMLAVALMTSGNWLRGRAMESASYYSAPVSASATPGGVAPADSVDPALSEMIARMQKLTQPGHSAPVRQPASPSSGHRR